MSNTYEQLESFAGSVNLIFGGESMSLDQMERKISGLKANNDYYTEWDTLTQDVEDLAEYAGIDISDCESPNKVCALVLAEMKKRLMPDGCEWPRFEDGLPVHLGDEVVFNVGEYAPVECVAIYKNRANLVDADGSQLPLQPWARAHHPLILAKDGDPIEIGQTVYGGDARAWTVSKLHYGQSYPVEAVALAVAGELPPGNPYITKRLKTEWLTHEEPDTWEKLQRDVANALKAEHCRVKDDAGLDRRAADLVARAKKLGGGANGAR